MSNLGVGRNIGRFTVALALGALVALGMAGPASAKKVKFGVAPQTVLQPSDYTLMNQTKLSMIRVGLSWTGVQQGPGTCTATGGACDWGFPDKQIGDAAANGFNSVPGIFGSPAFMSSTPAKPPTSKKDIAAWKQFISAAAQRYGPGGVYWQGPYQARHPGGAVRPVREWQIWNEPSSFQFFKPKPNVKKYAKILIPASQAIRAENKRAKILLGGMFPDTGPKGIRIEKYLAQLYKVKGAKKAFDVVSVHPYAKNPKVLTKQIMQARKAMNKSGGKKHQIWVTEIGYASKGPKKKPVVKKGEKGQAKAITAAYKTLNKKRKKFKLGGVIHFTVRDSDEQGVCKFCRRAGILDTNGNPKRAYNAFKKAIR